MKTNQGDLPGFQVFLDPRFREIPLCQIKEKTLINNNQNQIMMTEKKVSIMKIIIVSQSGIEEIANLMSTQIF